VSDGWEVILHGEFEPEFDALPEGVQDELLAHARLLQQFGPQHWAVLALILSMAPGTQI
jgi:hypothetical protein